MLKVHILDRKRKDSGVSLLGVTVDGWEGGGVYVENVDANDARFAQTVSVKPDTIYRVVKPGTEEDVPAAPANSEKEHSCFVFSPPLPPVFPLAWPEGPPPPGRVLQPKDTPRNFKNKHG